MSRASLAPDSPRKVVRTALIFSASASWMAMSCTFTVLPLFLTEFADQDHARDGVEGVEHAVAVHGHGFEERDLPAPSVEHVLHVLERRDVLQDELARHVVVDLPRNRVELELGGETAHGGGRDGQEVEEERAVVTRGERDHVPLARLRQALVDVLEVRGFSRHSGAVVHDLEVDDLLRVVDDRHGFPQASLSRAAVRSTCRRTSPGRPVSPPAITRTCDGPAGAGSLRISTRVFPERSTAE